MKPQETRFSYVYQNLKGKIISGQLLPGSRLSSSRDLCEEYHVGIYTITNVLNALREEGLIDIQPRRAAIVLPWNENQSPFSEELTILEHRDNLLQLYQTFSLLLPAFMTFASQNCRIEDMPHYKRAMKVAQNGVKAGGWRVASALIGDILNSSGNALLFDLYTLFELNSNLTFFTEKCQFFIDRFLNSATSVTEYIVEVLKGTDPVHKYGQLAGIYGKLSMSVDETLKYLADKNPEYPAQNDFQFSWNPLRGRNFCYARIVQDLTNKIGSGVYPEGTFLPHEAELAEQYEVSVFTVRKALDILERRGFSKTLNAKGTLVLLPDDSVLSRTLQDKAAKKEILTYLCSLQLIILLIRPAALLAMPHFREEDVKELDVRLKTSGNIILNDIFQSLLKRLKLEPFRDILAETSRISEFGYYMSFYPDRLGTRSQLNEKGLESYGYLRNGDAEAFAESMEDCYRHILTAARAYMVEKYNFNEALSVRIPEKVSVGR